MSTILQFFKRRTDLKPHLATLKEKKTHRKPDRICGYQRQGVGVAQGRVNGRKVQISSSKIDKYWEYKLIAAIISQYMYVKSSCGTS